MPARIKSVFLLIGTLVIGLVLGALVHARMADQRIERIEALRSPPGYVRYMERSIDFRDEAQRTEVQDILDRSSQRMAEHMQRSRQQVRAIIDSTRAELRQVLTEDQLRQLDERIMPRQERWRDGRGPRDGRGRRFLPPEAPPLEE